MTVDKEYAGEESRPLTKDVDTSNEEDHKLRESFSSISTTSLVLEHLNDDTYHKHQGNGYSDAPANGSRKQMENFDEEDGTYYSPPKPVDRKARRMLWLVGLLCFVGWILAAGLFLARGTYKHASTKPHDPAATASRGSGKQVTLDQVLGGQWRARKHSLSWIASPGGTSGADGLLLEKGEPGKNYLVVEDVRYRNDVSFHENRRILMKDGAFWVGQTLVMPSEVWPSPDMKYVLCLTDRQSNWRHSFTGRYWIFHVETQTAQPLDWDRPDDRVQLASWSPQSDAIVFTRDNNMFLRPINGRQVFPITTDGGADLFYGVPDWVYEEEVFASNKATWWSQDGEYIAFLRTNETRVPTYPVQYFVSRPSGDRPGPGLENYPETRDIKYPKAGAPNPIVHLQFYDVKKREVFAVPITGDFSDDNRLITEVVWAGAEGKVLVRETNRVSDVLKVVLMDVRGRKGQTVREQDVKALDGGWFEVSEETTFIPADPKAGREQAGYIDTIIHEGFDHLAYFSPLDNPKPTLLTSGDWEVIAAPSAVDLQNNWVYFIATRDGSTQRHVYRVNLDGTNMVPVTDTTKDGYHSVSFSTGAGYALLSYDGPDIPWQKVISLEGAPEKYEDIIENNQELASFASEHELPIMIYSTIEIDGVQLNAVERRPPHFNPKRKYPVLFWMYQGPGSQSVDKRWNVDFQAYVAANLGYIVVTVDGRGTGFLGRKVRCVTRGNLGHWEAHDQIAAARMWSAKSYVDSDRMAIWGWSFGGFMTLKVLEADAGETFKYGMAVAPVTDWAYYGMLAHRTRDATHHILTVCTDSIYTERYMFTPQMNPDGYFDTSIHDASALGNNTRFLIMHGTSDDNVHTQSTYTLLDKLDLAGVENYDVHVFPDSDHGIYFHNAGKIVHDKLSNWLVNAFNGEWLKTDHPRPLIELDGRRR